MFAEPAVNYFRRSDQNMIVPLFVPKSVSDHDLIGSDSFQINSIDRSRNRSNDKGRQFKRAFGSEFSDAFSSLGKAFGSGFGSKFGKSFNDKNRNNRSGRNLRVNGSTKMFGSFNKDFFSRGSTLGLGFRPFGKTFKSFNY